jgi:quinohemoprotein ethanol dehydrogenase
MRTRERSRAFTVLRRRSRRKNSEQNVPAGDYRDDKMKYTKSPKNTLLAMMLVAGCTATAQQKQNPVDDAALRRAASDGKEWVSYGRDYAETRFSPLKQIDTTNVQQLGLTKVWPTEALGALEATPLVHDGVLYGTLSYGVVFAFDLRTGERLWQYDPQVTYENQQKACCGVVNRGVALYQGRVYAAALDGRLTALDAKTGKVDWQVQTTPPDDWYTITGAPRVIKGKVIIGNGGAEYAVRGFVSAYDAATGKMAWRFYTVPGDPSKPFENPELAEAAKTWTGEWWKMGGGGTPWDAIAYDAEADLMYVGSGNGGPWDRNLRSPGGGDNLYLSCILAIHPDTGRLAWYYQTTPGDSWDYTATQQITLADIRIGGTVRKVLMQAPKNGFFYVLDRITGKLISAEPYGNITWAKGVDMKTGRPIENDGVRYPKGTAMAVSPGPGGVHNWDPMAWDQTTGLMYVPGQNSTSAYSERPDFEYRKGQWNSGVGLGRGNQPPPPAIGPALVQGQPGFLTAWDPVAQKERWRINYTTLYNGGVVATAGNLVFQGTADGKLVAYSADKGEKLWEMSLGVRNMASPIVYELDGKQYIAIMGGRAANMAAGLGAGAGAAGKNQNGPGPKLFIFGLNGKKSVEEALPKP